MSRNIAPEDISCLKKVILFTMGMKMFLQMCQNLYDFADFLQISILISLGVVTILGGATIQGGASISNPMLQVGLLFKVGPLFKRGFYSMKYGILLDS